MTSPCAWGFLGKVIGIDGLEATVDFFGVTRKVRLGRGG